MKCLLVSAHPLRDSLCANLADHCMGVLLAAGHEVQAENLYESGFDPRLSEAERSSYCSGTFDRHAVAGQIQRLTQAESLVLVFPTWWFGPPAILKGWFDRVWAPGVAYAHDDDLGPIRPKLLGLRRWR